VSELPDEAINFIKAVTAHFGAPAAVLFRNKQKAVSMKKFDDTNRGVLFKNDRKQSEKHADYKGNINVNGEDFWLDAWIRESKKGKFLSISIKPKAEEKPVEAKPDFNDEIEF